MPFDEQKPKQDLPGVAQNPGAQAPLPAPAHRGVEGLKSMSAFPAIDSDRQDAPISEGEAELSWSDEEQTLRYRARAELIDVRNDEGRLLGQMFALSYQVIDPEAKTARPVSFCFNGGPGCASVPINFGGIGPMRTQTQGINHIALEAPTVDNPHTLLKYSDLVFLDALGTGFSRVAKDAEAKELFGVDADARCFRSAIMNWLELHKRWSSPLYIYGESYGTTRNAVLARLLGEAGLRLHGVVMLSALFDWAQVLPGNDLYYLGMVPTFAATAHYFGCAGKGASADDWFARACDFCDNKLVAALIQGDRLDPQREAELAAELAELLGLETDYVLYRHLRIELDDYRLELLRTKRQVLGRLDMRFVSDAPSSVQRDSGFFEAEDAAADAVEAAWNLAFRDFLNKIGCKAPAFYLANNYEKIGKHWDFVHPQPGCGVALAPNVAYDLAVALRRNPLMRVVIMGGLYDAATTFWNVEHDISRLFLAPELRERISFKQYRCGHMAYVDEETLVQMDKDHQEFYQTKAACRTNS